MKKDKTKKTKKDFEIVFDKDDTDVDDKDVKTEALNLAQRRKRSISMRKNKARIALGRRKAAKKMPGMEQIEKRANKQAINKVREIVAKSTGKNYNDMSPAQKMVIDKKVEAKKVMKNRIARKLKPLVRQKARERLRGPKTENVDIRNVADFYKLSDNFDYDNRGNLIFELFSKFKEEMPFDDVPISEGVLSAIKNGLKSPKLTDPYDIYMKHKDKILSMAKLTDISNTKTRDRKAIDYITSNLDMLIKKLN